jgi:hypothetical protein
MPMNRERTDVAAETHLGNQLGHGTVRRLAGGDFAIQFEGRINENGIPVRRLVAYGPEECDPTVPSDAAAAVAGEPALEPAAA